jgi:hypothetical protein
MGEAALRGPKEVRLEQAVEKQIEVDGAAEKREHHKGLVWLVIEFSASEPQQDETGAFVPDAANPGKLLHRPKKDGLTPLSPLDTPEWLKDPEIIDRLRNGFELNRAPADGGLWYRGKVCTPSKKQEDAPV